MGSTCSTGKFKRLCILILGFIEQFHILTCSYGRMRPCGGQRALQAPIVARQLLQTIQATSPKITSMILLYPEAYLFPRLFPCTVDYAPLGAMPLSMMLKPWSGKGSMGGMGTFMEHISIRTRNHLLMTAMQQNYRSDRGA